VCGIPYFTGKHAFSKMLIQKEENLPKYITWRRAKTFPINESFSFWGKKYVQERDRDVKIAQNILLDIRRPQQNDY
jgi:hypothetical protein